MTFHDKMYCTMNFLSLLVATSKKHNFLSIRKIMFAVFLQLTSYKALLFPDYGLFIGYQMPTDKHEGLKACLHLLCKDLNNLAELGTLLPST